MTLSEILYVVFFGFLSLKMATSVTTPGPDIQPSSSEPMGMVGFVPTSMESSDFTVRPTSTSIMSSTSTSEIRSISSSSIETSPTSTPMMTFNPIMPTMTIDFSPSATLMTTSPETTIVTTTSPTVPEQPMEFNISDVTATSVTFTWKKPTPRPGPTNYTLLIYEQSDLSDGNVSHLYHTETITDYDTDNYTAYNLTSFWYYRATIQATNTVGSSPLAEIGKFQTKASAPGKVENVSVYKGYSYTVAKVKWDCLGERERHGDITGYKLTYLPNTQGRIKSCGKEVKIDVKAGQTYKVCVEPISQHTGEETCFNYTAPEGYPAYDNSLKSKFRIISSGETTMSLNITCTKCLLENKNGEIVFVGIFVCKDGCNEDSMPEEFDRLKSMKWYQANRNDFQTPYRVTKSDFHRQLAAGYSYRNIVIGEDKECPKYIQSDKACNGPLQDDTTYKVIVALCTSIGCTSVAVTTFKTEEETNVTVPIVVTLVVLLLIAAGVACGVFLYRRYGRRKKNIPKKKRMINRPVPIQQFNDLLREMHKDDDRLFLMDFEAIKENCPNHPCLAASEENNKFKNRYDNILPYDRSRVMLKEIYFQRDTSYINANYISGCDMDGEYISTQGPLINTVNDFWRMVWEQEISTIVMLSDFTENNIPKVDRYYEELDKRVQYGDIQVILKDVAFKSVNNYPESLFRIQTFQLTMDDEVRTVKHFFLKGWRDFSASVKPGVVIEFIDNVRKNVNQVSPKPILVHCSAGVGRSGTFIALDIMQKYLRQITMDAIIDIPDLVMRLRNYRCLMVQSLPQYIFLHETVNVMIERKVKLEKGLIDTDVDGSFFVLEDTPDLLQGGYDLSNAESESEEEEDQPEPNSSLPISEEQIKKSVEDFNFLCEEDDGEAEKDNRKSRMIELSDINVENGLDNKAFESDTDIDIQDTPKDVKLEINE